MDVWVVQNYFIVDFQRSPIARTVALWQYSVRVFRLMSVSSAARVILVRATLTVNSGGATKFKITLSPKFAVEWDRSLGPGLVFVWPCLHQMVIVNRW